MAKLELCRPELKITESATLGVHSNVAGDQADYTAGHSWVTVETTSKVYFFGLWPDGHPRVTDKREECSDVRVGMEVGARAVVSHYYGLSSGQLERLNRYINRPEAWGYLNTCAAWVAQLVREVIGTRLSAVDYFAFSTPRELGKELFLLEKKFPTTRRSPRISEAPEVIGSW